MKEFVEFIAKHLVDNPDGIIVEEKTPEESKIVILLRVEHNDIGKVIGKKGKTAKAMRTLLTAVSAKEGKKSVLDIVLQ
jgi:predicted RNA-binding protein YlqC (UPF0109 family)